MNSRYKLLSLLLMLALCSVPLLAQDAGSTREKIDFGFIPGEASKRPSQMKAASLERQLAAEKLLLPQIQSEIDRYDITYYDIFWHPDFSDSSIYGEVIIYGRSLDPALERVMLMLGEEMHVDSVYDSYGRRPITHSGSLLYIDLDHAHSEGEEFNFTVKYKGCPPTSSYWFPGLMFSTHNGVPIVENLSEPFGAHNWWPCKDIPWDKADSVDVRIKTDTGMTATSNGLLISDTDHGDGTHTAHWRHRYPIMTYNVCIAVTNFISETEYYVYSPTDSMPIVNYILPERAGNEAIAYDISAQALAVFADLFGEYPFIKEKFGHTMCNIYGIEHQTNSFLNFDLSCYENIVVHELVHHWWGNLVTCASWEHVWLNEGLAYHAEQLFYEVLYGPAYYRALMDSIKYSGGGTVYVYDVSDPWEIFATITGSKGAWVSHMLRGIVGDSAFFNGLKLYGQTYAYGNATSDDFKEIMETVSGQDLDYFFEEWLYGEYYPDYVRSFYTEENPGGGWDTYVHIRQIQETNPLVFTMPLDIRIITYSGDSADFSVFNNRREQDFFIFHTESKPKNIALDPDNWVLHTSDWEQYGLRILNDSLSDGVQGEPYMDSVFAKGGYPGHALAYAIIAGELPPGINLDAFSGIISGTGYVAGDIDIAVEVTDELFPASYADTAAYTIHFAPADPRPGDANADGETNVGDAVYLVNYIFKQGPPPPIANWADANADCQTNVGDVVYLIAFIFKGGPAPQYGCVE